MNIKSNKSIYLADDDADDCMLFEDALREISISTELTTANDGVELITLMESTVPPAPDIIFLDLNMPRMNGIECLIKIRNNHINIPVIILSTSNSEELIRQTKTLGASGYICKPDNFKKYRSVMKDVLSIDWKKHDPLFYLSID